MLSEFAVAGIYVPPLFVHVVAAARRWLVRALLRAAACPAVWHPALFEIAVGGTGVGAASLCLTQR